MSATDWWEATPWYRLREAAYDAIYVSPHMDDAVYSCGGQIALARAQGARILIVTLFGTGSSTERGRGLFGDVLRRKREERAAADLLDVDHLWLNAPDALFRKKSARELVRYSVPLLRIPESPLRVQLRACVQALALSLLAQDGRMYFPLAIGAHPDHRESYELGRALHCELPMRVLFYEDAPYAQVRAVREERLRYLGVKTPPRRPLRTEVHEVTAFVFAHQRGLQRRLASAIVWGHLATMRGLLRTVGVRDPLGARLRLEEIDISDVVQTKVAAMRAYASQTGYFYPAGAALYDVLSKSGGRYVERVWTLSTGPTDRAEQLAPLPPELVARERARIEALERSKQP